MAAISPDGSIVGIVVEVNDNYSKIMSLLHRNSKVSAMLKRDKVAGTVEWDGIDPDILILKNISKSAAPKKGDSVLAYDVKNNIDHFVEVVDIHENEVEVYEVEMEDGTKICCSMDHKFLCGDKKMHTLRDIISQDLEIMCK